MSQITANSVLAPYIPIIANFNATQRIHWLCWPNLPDKVARVKNEHMRAGKKVGFWKGVNYFSIVLSAAVPIIVTILVNAFSVTFLAQLLDVVFPVIAGIVQKEILSEWSKKRQAFAQVVHPYSQLLTDIIMDIYNNRYSQNAHQLYQAKDTQLDAIILPYL